MREQYIIKFILSIVKNTIHEEVSSLEDCTEVDWQRVYEIAYDNMLLPLLYDPVQKLAEIYKIPEELLAYWKKIALESMLSEYEKYRALRQLLGLAKEQNITCILFKGCVLADMYPKYAVRVSSDTDIFIYQRDKDKVIKLFESLGYRKDEQSSKELVYVYRLDVMRHKVELHLSLWEDYKGSKIDLIENMNLTKEESLIKINACGMEITTLGYEEHLIFQMFHIIKHFSLQGVSIRYLIDVTLYVKRCKDYINFEYFWNKMEILNYDKFCENFFSICVQYLDMSPEILEGREIRVIPDTEKFLRDMINVGSIFDKKTTEWQLLSIMSPYFSGGHDIPKSKFGRQIKILFPASKDLPNEYAYARKYKIFLPIAWIHKYCCFFIKWHKHKGDWYDAKEKFIITEHRLSLMKSLGLVDGGKNGY